MGIDFHVIIGNHDVPYRNTNEVNSMRELFGVDKGESFPKFYSEPTTVNVEGCDICMMPWINNSNYNHAMTHIKNTKAKVLFGHLDVAGFHMNKDMVSEGGLQPKIFENFDLVVDLTTNSQIENLFDIGKLKKLKNYKTRINSLRIWRVFVLANYLDSTRTL